MPRISTVSTSNQAWLACDEDHITIGVGSEPNSPVITFWNSGNTVVNGKSTNLTKAIAEFAKCLAEKQS